ncbi:hypothetical protein RB595_004703 [Gaeumannomyces hyphopodioides]
MSGFRICPSCGINIRNLFGRQCTDCDARQRHEDAARLVRRVRFDDDPAVVRRSRSPCRLRIRRSGPRAEDDGALVRYGGGNNDYDLVNVNIDVDDSFCPRPATTATVTRYYTTTRPSGRDRDRGRDLDVERTRLREARDRGVSENGTRWSSSRRDFERERLDRYGGREYDREVDWEIRRSRPRRDRDIFDICYDF